MCGNTSIAFFANGASSIHLVWQCFTGKTVLPVMLTKSSPVAGVPLKSLCILLTKMPAGS